MQYTGNYNFAIASATMMANECEELAIRNTTTAKNDSSEGEKVLKEVMDSVCPNDCAFNGNCSGGTCICAEGFTAADCSISLYQKPEIARWVRLRKWNPPLITESITFALRGSGNLTLWCGEFHWERISKEKNRFVQIAGEMYLLVSWLRLPKSWYTCWRYFCFFVVFLKTPREGFVWPAWEAVWESHGLWSRVHQLV